MKFKKSIFKLFSFLLLMVLSLSLFTGCTQEDAELALDVLTTVLEAEVEEDVYDEAAVEEDSYREETVTDDDSHTENAVVNEEPSTEETVLEEDTPAISVDGTYTSKEDVSAYLHEYGHLPSNFITKKEAKKLGWVSSEGNLDKVAPGMSIGGDYFGNYEGTLPETEERDYYECDIDFDGTYRNAKRIVFSNDGLIYYTEDHYETFELLYGEE